MGRGSRTWNGVRIYPPITPITPISSTEDKKHLVGGRNNLNSYSRIRYCPQVLNLCNLRNLRMSF